MTLSQNLEPTSQQSSLTLAHFSELIDLNWIKQSLQQTGKPSIRRRKSPAKHVVVGDWTCPIS